MSGNKVYATIGHSNKLRSNILGMYGMGTSTSTELNKGESIELLEEQDLQKGGKRAQIGEVRLWAGQKWVKHSEGWVHVHEKSGKATLEKPGGAREAAGEHHISHYKEHMDRHTRESSTHEGTQSHSEKRQGIVDSLKKDVSGGEGHSFKEGKHYQVKGEENPHRYEGQMKSGKHIFSDLHSGDQKEVDPKHVKEMSSKDLHSHADKLQKQAHSDEETHGSKSEEAENSRYIYSKARQLAYDQEEEEENVKNKPEVDKIAKEKSEENEYLVKPGKGKTKITDQKKVKLSSGKELHTHDKGGAVKYRDFTPEDHEESAKMFHEEADRYKGTGLRAEQFHRDQAYSHEQKAKEKRADAYNKKKKEENAKFKPGQQYHEPGSGQTYTHLRTEGEGKDEVHYFKTNLGGTARIDNNYVGQFKDGPHPERNSTHPALNKDPNSAFNISNKFRDVVMDLHHTSGVESVKIKQVNAKTKKVYLELNDGTWDEGDSRPKGVDSLIGKAEKIAKDLGYELEVASGFYGTNFKQMYVDNDTSSDSSSSNDSNPKGYESWHTKNMNDNLKHAHDSHKEEVAQEVLGDKTKDLASAPKEKHKEIADKLYNKIDFDERHNGYNSTSKTFNKKGGRKAKPGDAIPNAEAKRQELSDKIKKLHEQGFDPNKRQVLK